MENTKRRRKRQNSHRSVRKKRIQQQNPCCRKQRQRKFKQCPQLKGQVKTSAPLLLFQQIMTGLGSVLICRTASWFGVLVVGILLAIAKRRTITKRIQAAGLSTHFQRAFYHLTNIGRKYPQLFKNMLEQIILQSSIYNHQLLWRTDQSEREDSCVSRLAQNRVN
ncbi:MAG: hypothetical protein LBF88_10205 [Planctomycetaceae bacterium]|jgi:hypothetical protein|nr:hypothetical protein [Planctomycetaceae bacterium]